MKTIKSLFILLALTCIATSCINNAESHTTPQMMFGNLYVNPQFVGDSLIGAKDTLDDHYDVKLEKVYVDTLQLGDTVMFPALFTSNTNNLVSVVATYDTVNINLWFDIDPQSAEMNKALTSASNPQEGRLYFNPMYYITTFPIYIVPQAAGSYPIKLTVTSDSDYPTYSVEFTLPVK